jgi:replicative DNA helicase
MNEKRDNRLTDKEQLAVVGYCMKDAAFYHRVKEKLLPSYFTDTITRGLYEYVVGIYSAPGLNKYITEEMLRSEVKKQQADPDSIRRYQDQVVATQVQKANFTIPYLVASIQKQLSHYEYIPAVNEVAKHAGTGDKEKTVEAMRRVIEIENAAATEAPSAEETIALMKAQQKRWEESVKNSVPFISPALTDFVFRPGIIVMGAVTKGGKSTVLANALLPILDRFQQKKIVVITAEDDLNLVASRAACASLAQDLRAYRFQPYTIAPEMLARIEERKEQLCQYLTVYDSSFGTRYIEDVQDILANVDQENTSAIFIDYYQIINSSRRNSKDGFVEVHKKFGMWLKDFGLTLKIPLIIFAQLYPQSGSGEKEVPFQQRIQYDRTLCNHAHQNIEIIKPEQGVGFPATEFHLINSRHGETPRKLATFRYDFGRLVYPPTP